MKRKIYKQLLKWKENKDRKPLMLLGARQVGKTWIMQHFGKKEYKNVAYINCDDEPRMKQLFELDYTHRQNPHNHPSHYWRKDYTCYSHHHG